MTGPRQVYKALKVSVDDITITSDQLNDGFSWLDYEEFGGTFGVSGSPLFSAEPLQSSEAREDAVRHGYIMVYQMDDNVSALNLSMQDYFFSITFDAGIHHEYEALGRDPNSTVRFSLFEVSRVPAC